MFLVELPCAFLVLAPFRAVLPVDAILQAVGSARTAVRAALQLRGLPAFAAWDVAWLVVPDAYTLLVAAAAARLMAWAVRAPPAGRKSPVPGAGFFPACSSL